VTEKIEKVKLKAKIVFIDNLQLCEAQPDLSGAHFLRIAILLLEWKNVCKK